MIARLTGRVAAVCQEAVVIEVGGIGYEVLIPASAREQLQSLVGSELTLLTIQYFEGNPAGAHLIPRLLGFLTEADRAFFSLLTKVKGISSRRALRAMSLPVWQIAAAIERGDLRLLASLPEIGKKTAAQLVTQLQGKVLPFVQPGPGRHPPELTEAQRIAVDILVQWGDRRTDAERWVAAAAADSSLTDPEALVRAAYRLRQTQ